MLSTRDYRRIHRPHLFYHRTRGGGLLEEAGYRRESPASPMSRERYSELLEQAK